MQLLNTILKVKIKMIMYIYFYTIINPKLNNDNLGI